MSEEISIDETSLSRGELYTIISNKKAHSKKRTIIAMIKGVESENIISIFQKIPTNICNVVKEITLDMSSSFTKVMKTCFSKAIIVIDRFHVQQLANECIQRLRVDLRWTELDKDNLAFKNARKNGLLFKKRE